MTHLPKTQISAAISTYSRYDLLEQCIDSLVAQNIAADQYKIIVIDNSPANEIASRFQKRYDGQDNIHYFIEKTPGLSNARNVAAHMCNSEYIAYIDDDAIADHAWLASILDAFEKFGSQAGAVCGKVIPIWPIEPPKWLATSHLSALTVVDHGETMRIATAEEGFAGTNFSVRVAPLLGLGCFSQSLGRTGHRSILLSNEEHELLSRMRSAGYATIWTPHAKVQHRIHEERVRQAWLRKRYAWQAVSDFITDPDTAMKTVEQKWQSVLYYMQHWPPHLRNPQALFESTDDPIIFEQQTYATYCLTILLLAGEGIQSRDEKGEPATRTGHSHLERRPVRKLLGSLLTTLLEAVPPKAKRRGSGK